MKINNHLFYKKAILKYGLTARGVHWDSSFTQYLRFEVILQFIENLNDSSIVDVGCGFGEFLCFLEYKKIKAKEYLGIDCEEQMIKISKSRFKTNNFLVKDVLKDTLIKKDYYICSGALNLLEFKEFKVFIKNCFKNSQKAFIFNFLIKKSFTNINKEEVISFCQTLTSKISIECNYLENDCTIKLEK